MSAPPFNNLYECKHVSPNASKACIICFKPTSTVLITLNQKDWFYVCESHIRDKHFAELVYRDSNGVDATSQWSKLCSNVEKKKSELSKHNKELQEKSKNGWFDKINGIWKSAPESTTNDDSNDEHLSELKNNSSLAETELKEFEKTNIKYKLDPIFYKRRLMEDYQRQKQKETMKKMQEGELFPSTNSLSQLP